jgi:oligoribonuclease NrnB/cAMP/cGMP phosphodiesterase (DHH superfamily)
MDFNTCEKLDTDSLIKEGEILVKYQNQIIEKITKNARIVKIAEYQVLAVNSPILQSEIANYLCKMHSQYPFAVAYFDVGTQRNFSLRSIGDFDVAAIASKYGGGGHKNAAGFIKNIDEWFV